MTFLQRHNARIALAGNIAGIALKRIINTYLFHEWSLKVECTIHSFIMNYLKPFINSNDVKDIKISRFINKDFDLIYEVKIIPNEFQYVDMTIDIGELNNENN